MTTLADLAGWLETFAPSSLAESWDNVGLLLGDPASTIERVMTCLTVTPATATEAIKAQVDAIVSHHPILFRPAKSIRADRSENAEVRPRARRRRVCRRLCALRATMMNFAKPCPTRPRRFTGCSVRGTAPFIFGTMRKIRCRSMCLSWTKPRWSRCR